VAGLVLGVQSVPDGLAPGVLAGVIPLAGLYAYLFGTISGSLFTSSVFMAVQATGAMSIIIADVPAVHAANEQAGALVTLSVLTGAVGRTDLGTTFTGVLERYARGLVAVGSKPVIVSVGEQVREQLRVTGVTDVVGSENIYTGNERIGSTLKRAYTDAAAWIQQNQRTGEAGV
jgi:hypothetical protein